jgi:hypothetical protein
MSRSIGEGDIQLVNDFLMSITSPEAKAAALGIHDKMIEVRDVKPLRLDHRRHGYAPSG